MIFLFREIWFRPEGKQRRFNLELGVSLTKRSLRYDEEPDLASVTRAKVACGLPRKMRPPPGRYHCFFIALRSRYSLKQLPEERAWCCKSHSLRRWSYAEYVAVELPD